MTNNYIDFKRQRDLGEIISDTFAFVRDQYKPLLKAFFKMTGPAFLLLLLSLAFYSYMGLDLMGGGLFDFSQAFDSGIYLLSAFLMFAALLTFYALLNSCILHFIQSYIAHEGKADFMEVRQGMKSDFLSMLGLIIIGGILVGVGLLFCVLPGIFLWVPVSLSPAILVFDRKSVTESISESFTLIKENWWITFFTLLLMTILVYIIGLIFQFPMLIYYFLKAFTMVQEGSAADPSSLFDWVYVVFNVISSLFQYLLSSIVIIALEFIFFNLKEQKYFTGSYEKISKLGSESNR